MADELARLGPAAGKPKAVDDVIQPALKQFQQSGAGRFAGSQSHHHEAPELPLVEAVHPFYFLFLSQLSGVLAFPTPGHTPVHPRWLVESPLQALSPGAKEILALTPGKFMLRSPVAHHRLPEFSFLSAELSRIYGTTPRTSPTFKNLSKRTTTVHRDFP
jgi:hypothetical protein